MDFLGNVNVFHGRVQDGRARSAVMEVECPEYPHEESRPATLYVRPHELEIEHSPNGVRAVSRPSGADQSGRFGGQGVVAIRPTSAWR